MIRTTIQKIIRSVVLVSLLVAIGAGSAGAIGDTPVATDLEQASILASPGVVLVDTWATVNVRVGDRVFEVEYAVASGSGFIVTPEGDIVTASHVIDLTVDDRLWLRNAAANELMGLEFGADEDPGARYELEDPDESAMLAACYEGLICEFKITRHVDVYTPVALAGTQAPRGLIASVVVSTGYEGTDIAVLKVNGKNMSTVPLADSIDAVESADQVVALGFAGSSLDNGGTTEPAKLFGHVSAVRDIGASRVVEVDVDVEGGMSGGPTLDQSGLVIGVTSATGIEGSQRTQGYVRSIDDVHAALAKAGVEPSRGMADQAFSQAMTLYWGDHYSAAIPLFRKVLNLADGHPLATQYLAEAEELKGTPADKPLEQPTNVAGGPPFMLMAGGAGALLILTLAGAMVARRRRNGRTAAELVASGSSMNGSPSITSRLGVMPSGEQALEPESEQASVATIAPEGSRYCPGCGSAASVGDRFCSSCANPLR